MPPYFTELHAHTAETSRCAEHPAAALVENYIASGYSTLVITDHFSDSTFEAYLSPKLSKKAQVEIFLRGYRAAKAAAKDRLQVLLGMELRFKEQGNINDYLVYGLQPEFLQAHPDLLSMRLPEFSALAHKNNLLVFQAHPFRNGMQIVRPALLDGYEIYNACVRHSSRNEIAAQWAQRHKKIGISGSDYHRPEDVARGGIETEEKILSNEQLLDILRREAFRPVRK